MVSLSVLLETSLSFRISRPFQKDQNTPISLQNIHLCHIQPSTLTNNFLENKNWERPQPIDKILSFCWISCFLDPSPHPNSFPKMICKPISQILSKMLSFNNLRPDDPCAFGYCRFSRRLSAILTQPLRITYAVSFIVHLYFFKFGLFQIWALFGKASSLKRRFCVCFRWLDCFIDYFWRGLQHFNFGYGLCVGSIDESES